MVLLFLKRLSPPSQVPRRLCLAEQKLSVNVYQVLKPDRQGTDGLMRLAKIPRKDEMEEGAFTKHLMPGPRLPASTHEISFSNYIYLLIRRKL